MPLRTMFPRFYAIFRWSAQKGIIGVLVYLPVHVVLYARTLES